LDQSRRDSRWKATSRRINAELLENADLLIRDGVILDIRDHDCRSRRQAAPCPRSPSKMLAVRLFLSSGDQRTIAHADSARIEGSFFIVSRWYPDLNRRETVLTLRAEDVAGAEVLEDGVKIDYIAGRR
jgi:hypothetical protein